MARLDCRCNHFSRGLKGSCLNQCRQLARQAIPLRTRRGRLDKAGWLNHHVTAFRRACSSTSRNLTQRVLDRMDFELQIAACENVSVLRCRGRLTYGPETVEFVRATRQALETTGEIVLQMAEVTRIDSGGVGALGSVLITARRRNAEIKLAMLHPRVAEVLRITGLDLLFDIHTSESEAIAAFSTKSDVAR
jgi:anti-sigma B factor antagonist